MSTAFVKSFTLSLRAQFVNTTVAIIQIDPPLVESDLHRDWSNPDGFSVQTNKTCISQEDFIKQVEEGIKYI